MYIEAIGSLIVSGQRIVKYSIEIVSISRLLDYVIASPIDKRDDSFPFSFPELRSFWSAAGLKLWERERLVSETRDVNGAILGVYYLRIR